MNCSPPRRRVEREHQVGACRLYCIRNAVEPDIFADRDADAYAFKFEAWIIDRTRSENPAIIKNAIVRQFVLVIPFGQRTMLKQKRAIIDRCAITEWRTNDDCRIILLKRLLQFAERGLTGGMNTWLQHQIFWRIAEEEKL